MFDLKTEQGLNAFNKHLEENAYVTGFTLAGEDACHFAGFGNSRPNCKTYAHLARWYRNIESYSEAERKTWPTASSAAYAVQDEGNDNEDFDLFGSDDEEDKEKARITAERLKAYAEKKSKKPTVIAKSSVIFDVKPWDDTVSVVDIESNVRSVESDGLVWGAAKFLPVAFGIKKLQICCVIEDDKISTDWLEEKIMDFSDLVQSVDIVAFNKI